MMAPTPALRRAEAGRVGVTTPYNEQTTLLAYPGANHLDDSSRGGGAAIGPFTPYFQQGERLQFSPRSSSDRNSTSVGGAGNSLYDPEEERSRLERENFDLKMQVYTLEQKVNSLENELEGDVVQSSDDDDSVDWNAITVKEQSRRTRHNEDFNPFNNGQQQESLNLRQLLENQTKLLKENEARLVSRESVLEQACVAIEQLQVQCSTLIEEKQKAEDELFSANSRLTELEQRQISAVQRADDAVTENLRIKSELEAKTRQCLELESLRDQFEEQNLLLEEANVALAELQERDESDKDKIFDLVSREKNLTEQVKLEQRRNNELSRQLILAQNDTETYKSEAEKNMADVISYQEQQLKSKERENIMVRQIEDLTNQLKQAQTEAKSYQADAEVCDTQLRNCQKHISDLRQQLEDQAHKADEIALRKMEDLSRKLELVQNEMAQYKSDSENRQILLEDTETTITELRRQIEMKDFDVKDQIKRQSEGLSQLLESAERDAETYRLDLEEHKRLLKQSQVEFQQLEERLLSQSSDDLLKHHEIERLLKQVEVARQEITDYQTEIEVKNLSVTQLQDTVDVLQKQLKEQKSEMSVWVEEKTKDLMQQLQAAQHDNKSFLKEIEAQRRIVADFQEKNNDLQNQLDQKERESSVLLKQRAKILSQVQKFEENEKVYQSKIGERDKLLAESNVKVQEIQQQLEQRIHETNAQFQQQIHNTSQQLLSAQRDIKIYQVEVEERDRLLEEAATTIHQLHQQVEGKEHEADDFLQKQMYDITHQLNSARKEGEVYKIEIEGLNRRLREALSSVQDLQQQLAQKDVESNFMSQQQIKDLSRELQSARTDINALHTEIFERDKLLEDSKKALQSMQKKCEEKGQENSSLLHQIDELSHQLQSARRFNDDCQREMEVQSRSLEDATAKLKDMEHQVQAYSSDITLLQQIIKNLEENSESNLILQQKVEDLSKQLISSDSLNKNQREEIIQCNQALEDTRAAVQDLQHKLRKRDNAQANELSLELEAEKKRGNMYCNAVEERNKVLEEARSTIQELRARLEAMHKEADFVRGQQNSALSIRLQAVQKEADSVKSQNLALWEQLGSMEKDLHRYRSDIDERDEKLASANAALDELQRKFANNDQEKDVLQVKQYDELSRQLEAVQRYVFDYQTEVEDYHDELENVHAEVDELKHKLEEKRQSEESALMKTEDLAQQLLSASRVSGLYQAEIIDLRSKLAEAHTTIEKLQEKLKWDSKNHAEEMSHINDELLQLVMRKDYSLETSTFAETEERNKVLADARETIHELKERLQALHIEAKLTGTRNTELSTQLELAEKEVLSSRSKIVECNEKLMVLQATVNELQVLLDQKDKCSQSARSQIDAMTQQMEKLQRNEEDHHVEIKKLCGELSSSHDEIEELNQQLKLKVQEVEAAEKSNESMSQLLHTAQQEILSFQGELNVRDERLAQYEAIIQDTQRQYEEQKLLCADLSLKLNLLTSDNDSYQSRAAEQQKALSDANGLIDVLTFQLKEKESQVKSMELNLEKTVSLVQVIFKSGSTSVFS